MKIRLRGPAGTSTLTFDDAATIGDLRLQIREKTGLYKYSIKSGYPPKPLNLDQDATLLKSLGVKLDGEQLTIVSIESSSDRSFTTSSNLPQPIEESSIDLVSSQTRRTTTSQNHPSKPITLNKQSTAKDVPEIPLPDRGATLGMILIPFIYEEALMNSKSYASDA